MDIKYNFLVLCGSYNFIQCYRKKIIITNILSSIRITDEYLIHSSSGIYNSIHT